jgi:nucleoside triphosphate pyrophosphatase
LVARPKPSFVLASASPRRQEVMTRQGIPFRVLVSGVDEHPPIRLGPLRYVAWAAAAKAEAVARRAPAAVVIAADTEVVLDGRIFGKPSNVEEAAAFLRTLSGRTHQVYTAVHVIDGQSGCVAHGVSRTHVTMRELSRRAIAAYLRTGEAQDKAGAYAIQGEGRRLIESIRGPYDNVVGMPVRLLRRLLSECGIPLPAPNSDGFQHYVTAGHRRSSPNRARLATRGPLP